MLVPIDIIFDSDQVQDNAYVTGTRNTPVFNLQSALEDCVGFAVTYANVPFTYFVIDGTNNTFKVNTNVGSTTALLVTLAEGTYNVVNIVTQLKTQISAATAWTLLDFEVFIDSTTSKLVIYKLTNITEVFTLDFSVNNLGKILGFEKDIYTSTSSGVLDDSDTLLDPRQNIVAPRVVNLSGPAQMFLDSTLGPDIYGKVRNQNASRALLGFWPVNSNYQGTIEYLNPNPEMIPISKTKFTSIGLSLTLGNISTYTVNNITTSYLPLNGEPFQVGLRFWKDEVDNRRERDGMGNVTTSVRDGSSSAFRNLRSIGKRAR